LSGYAFFVEVRVPLLNIFIELGPAVIAVVDTFSLIVGARRKAHILAGQVARRTGAASPDQHAVVDEGFATFRTGVRCVHS
jgi:hypothetical protein